MENNIPFNELLSLAFTLGAPVFLASRICEIVVIRKYKTMWWKILVMMILAQIASLGLALVIWRQLLFHPYALQYRYIFLPAVFAELLVAVCIYLYITKLNSKWA